MKKTELRAELKKLDKTGLTKMFIAAYDELTPTKKEKIDALILDQGIEEEDTKEPKKKEFKIDMKALKDDSDAFVSNAEDGLYYSPNRKVSKTKRSKWRFEAKDYFKKLMEIPPRTANSMRTG